MKSFVLYICFGIFALPMMGQSWKTLSPGLELQRGSLKDGAYHVNYVLLRCDPKQRKIQVIDVRGALFPKNSASPFNLRAVQQAIHSEAVVNGGSTSNLNFPNPTGWLKISGKEISPAKWAAKEAGALCVTGNKVSVLRLSDRHLPTCTDAVQRGPYLSKQFVPERGFSDGRYNRTVVGSDDQGRLLLLVTQDPSSYTAVVSFLYSSDLGPNATAALSMDGGLSSGAIIQAGQLSESPMTAGDVDFLIASAIAIF
jgi:hypothetical protein